MSELILLPSPKVFDERPTHDYQLQPIPDWQRASYWGGILLSPYGIFGLLSLIVEAPVMIINSYFISLSFEYILDRAGEPITEIPIMGWNRVITDFDLMAIAIILCQVITAAVSFFKYVAPYSGYLNASNKNGFISAFMRSVFMGIVYVTLISLLGFEVYTAYLRGYYIEGKIDEARNNAWATTGIALSEVVLGTLSIDWFIIPLSLFLGWGVVTPFRCFWRWLKIIYIRRLSRKKPDEPGFVSKTIRVMDRNIMEPLRELDRGAYKVISRLGDRILTPGNDKRKGG